MNFWHRRIDGFKLALWLLFTEPFNDLKELVIAKLKKVALDLSDKEVEKKHLAGWGQTFGWRMYEYLDRF